MLICLIVINSLFWFTISMRTRLCVSVWICVCEQMWCYCSKTAAAASSSVTAVDEKKIEHISNLNIRIHTCVSKKIKKKKEDEAKKIKITFVDTIMFRYSVHLKYKKYNMIRSSKNLFIQFRLMSMQMINTAKEEKKIQIQMSEII